MAGGDEVDRARGRATPVRGPDRGRRRTVAASGVEVEDIREDEELVGEHLARVDWTRVSLRSCRVHLVEVAELVLDRARLIDSQLSQPNITQVSGADSTWRKPMPRPAACRSENSSGV